MDKKVKTKSSPHVMEKRRAKRQELTEGALYSLAELGYAETGLRKIAADLGVSLGVLHYHFESKDDLLITCTEWYVERFSRELENIFTGNKDIALRKFVQFMSHEAEVQFKLHRLWFELRAQSLFKPELRPSVEKFEAVFTRLSEAFLMLNNSNKREPYEVYWHVEQLMFTAVKNKLDGVPKAKEVFVEKLLNLHFTLTGERISAEAILERDPED